MRLGVIRRILKEDLDKIEATPEWVGALLEPLNEFITKTSQALTNNLGFTDNFAGKSYTAKFTHAVELSINPQVKTRITGVIPLSVDTWGTDGAGALPTLISKWGWVQKANGNIGLTFHFYGFESTGNTTSGSASLASVAAPANVKVGQYLSGDGIPVGTTVTAVSGSTVTMSANALVNQTGVRVTFSPPTQTVSLFLITG
jgi:hypothetical protein